MSRIYTKRFRSDPMAPGKARTALRMLNGHLDPQVADDVRLLVSELVTNSLRHTGTSEIELEIWGSADVVHVDVVDAGGGFDLPEAPRPGEASGWGLFMVDRLADRWGVETEGETRVWFEFRGPSAGGRAERELFATR